MELSFELLREAGIRLPGQLGGTMGVVGGLIVGQAAVDAHLVKYDRSDRGGIDCDCYIFDSE